MMDLGHMSSRLRLPLRKLVIVVSLLHALASVSNAIADTSGNLALRIESDEAHSAVITGLAVSADGSLGATGSNDRTVRIWRMPGLSPVRTIYLPIGRGNEGAVYTVAFSPDNKTIAASGWTGSWNGTEGPWCFYILDVDSGNVQRMVCDLPHRANHVTYSADGKYFAVALKNGRLRVYRTSDYQIVVERRDCPETRNSTWVEFDRLGRILTTCHDGKVRLYSKDFSLIASRAMPEGRRPDSLSISPDGSKVIVGYYEPGAQDPRWPPAVDVISVKDLSVLYRPDLRGVDNGALWRVAWSEDGNFVYATGTWRKGNRYPVRRWSDGGRGQPRDMLGATSHNLRLRSLPSGGFIFVGEVPYIGVVGNDGRLVAERQILMADFTDIGDKLGVSDDGYSIQYAFAPSGEELAHFSLAQGMLGRGEAPAAGKMSYRIIETAGLDVRDWSRGFLPTLNGKPLEMVTKNEHALSMTFAPDGKTFLLGTVWSIIRYDATGTIMWPRQISFNTHGVVITRDNRLAVAAIGDGTIRWYAMDTGKELLAYFPHRDGRRWVAWTPKGYYTASAGGENLIGWHVNRGQGQAADFFPLSKFRETFYRPDIVKRVLAELDEETAITRANLAINRTRQNEDIRKQQPPVVRILDHKIRDREIAIEYSVRSPSGLPVSRVFAQIDGAPIGEELEGSALAGQDSLGESKGTIKIKLPPRNATVSVTAEVGRAFGEATIAVTNDLAPEPPKHNLYAIVVGVGKYDRMRPLPFADDDAVAVADLLERQRGSTYADVNIKLFTTRQNRGMAHGEMAATGKNIKAGLNWLRTMRRDADGVILVYFSGHGHTTVDQSSFLLPADFDPNDYIDTALSKTHLLDVLARRGRVFLFIDACHAAGALAEIQAQPLDSSDLVNAAAAVRGSWVFAFASSLSDQSSFGTRETKSFFTTALVQGLHGKAAPRGEKTILTGDLDVWLYREVKKQSDGEQAAVMFKSPSAHHVPVAILP